ncbi:uncharacterized protein LOC103352987 [Stegastes partitus]|uniref:Uncharacterized protein LOC103352987 n=1 Tax=Stegastes partitus TaxID=144197 RepID=A0A9Y4MPK5_9TELE|nr:PREDICTED: uncharacterized protein LOC103352987 [Stegastes partitus]
MSSSECLTEFTAEQENVCSQENASTCEPTTVWKPEITINTAALPQHVYKEEDVFDDKQLCNQEGSCSLNDRGPPQIKEEQVELYTSLDQASQQLPQIKEEQEELFTCPDQVKPEPSQIKEEQEELYSSLEQVDPEPPHIKDEQDKFCTGLSQKDPEPPQIKEEQDELCTSQEGELLVVKQETDSFMETSAYEESDHSGNSPISDSHCDADASYVEVTELRSATPGGSS